VVGQENWAAWRLFNIGLNVGGNNLTQLRVVSGHFPVSSSDWTTKTEGETF
jgi:hypothetical protein